eukprot:gene1199-1309_t
MRSFQIIRRAIHVEARVKELGYALPQQAPSPKGNYTNFVMDGNLVYLSGHLPQLIDGTLIKGRLGEELTIEEGQYAARLAALQLLASLQTACGGDLDKVEKVIKLTGFVNSTKDFTSQPLVMNGCSDLIGEVFGHDVGRHARSAVGVNVLPLGVPVEIEAIIRIRK